MQMDSSHARFAQAPQDPKMNENKIEKKGIEKMIYGFKDEKLGVFGS